MSKAKASTVGNGRIRAQTARRGLLLHNSSLTAWTKFRDSAKEHTVGTLNFRSRWKDLQPRDRCLCSDPVTPLSSSSHPQGDRRPHKVICEVTGVTAAGCASSEALTPTPGGGRD